MVSIWLRKVKNRGKNADRKKIGFAERGRFSSNATDIGRVTAGIAGYVWCAVRPDHAGRSRTARKGIHRRSAYSGCRPPRGRAGRRGPQRRLRPCGGLLSLEE